MGNTQTKTSTQTKTFMPYIHVAIIFIFMFGFGYLPPIGTITPLGMQTLGIFIGVIYGWSTMGMIWPSLLGLFALSLLPGAGAINTFKTGMGDRITVAVFFLLIFGELINKVGLSKYIADWCVSRKLVVGKPYAIMAMFCLAGGIISAFVNCFAGFILMWGVFYNFCKEVGLKPGDAYARVTLIALVYISTMAGDILPFMGLSLLTVGLQENLLNIPMPYVQFTLAQLIMTLLASVLYFAFIKFVVKPDTTIVKNYVPDTDGMTLTNQQKFVAGLLVGLMVALFSPGILPAEWAITAKIKSLDIAGMLALVLVIYYIVNLRNENGISFVNLVKDINWSVVLMFAAVAPLAAAVSNPDSGILGYLTTVLSAFLGDMNPYAFTILILFMASILTQFCNNVAIVLMVVPIMFSFAVQLGANPVILSVLVAFNLNIAFATPAASGGAAMVFSNTAWIGVKHSYIHGLAIFVINMVVTIIGLPLAELLF